MKKKTLILSLAALVTFGGCATSGNERIKDLSQSTIHQQITEGKATTITLTDGGNEVWTYRYSRATPQAQNFIPIVNIFSQGADVTTKELVILFDKNNVVSKYTMREIKDVVKAGIAR